MKIKWVLIIAPLALIGVLFQSYFWVPSYESQTTGNPDRVWMYIDGYSADAKLLNPIVLSDKASSDIAERIFDGLLDIDEKLKLRGRLATDWSVTERAYLGVNPNAKFPDGTPVTIGELETRTREAIATNATLRTLVTEVRTLPPAESVIALALADKDRKQVKVSVTVKMPARVEYVLKRVDQDFFKRLAPVIGADYDKNFPREHSIRVLPSDSVDLVRPRFATLLPVFEHNPIILFTLRKGVRFQDGHEFDAGDVKFTYNAIMDPKTLSPHTSYFEPVKSVDVLDRHTLRVVYKRLFSPAIEAWTMGILPEHLLNEETRQREMDERGLSQAARETFGMRDVRFSRHPVGTGPFRFVRWEGDELIQLRRYDDYWEGAPLYHQYTRKVIPDPVTLEVEFRTGAIDSYQTFPYQTARYRKQQRYQAFSSLGFAYTYIGYNNRRELFKDKRVRRALGMAIDTEAIIEYVMYNEAKRTTGPYPQNTLWYDPSVKPLPYDPEGAEWLLGELGWKKNSEGWLEKEGKLFEFNLITNNGNPNRKQVLTIAQNSWRKIGVKCNTGLFEWAVFLENFINPLDFDAVVLGWSMSIDPDLYQIWYSKESNPYQFNFVGYDSPAADELILRIRQEYDEAEQVQMAHELHRIIAEDQPYTFLYAPIETHVFDKKIVMVEDGAIKPIRPEKVGVTFHFNKWRKVASSPVLAPE